MSGSKGSHSSTERVASNPKFVTRIAVLCGEKVVLHSSVEDTEESVVVEHGDSAT